TNDTARSPAGSTSTIADDHTAASAAKPRSNAYTRSTGTTSSGPTTRRRFRLQPSTRPLLRTIGRATSIRWCGKSSAVGVRVVRWRGEPYGRSSCATKDVAVALAPVRFGLLSTAAINAEILAAARVSDYADVAAVASRDRARADVYARQHGIPRAHGDYQDLLDDPHIDAVYVSLPNAQHAEWSIRALE